MTALKTSNIVDEQFFQQAGQAINAINVGLDALLEETKNKAIILGHEIEKDTIKSIVENLNRMEKAKEFVSQFLEKVGHINKCTEEVQILLAERINRFIDGINVLISSNNFYEADKKIDSITFVRDLLGSHCTEDISKQIDELKTNQKTAVLTDVVKKYSDMDISEYTLQPPTDILHQFGSIKNTNPIYNRAYNEIKKAIFTKLRTELDKAKSMTPLTHDNIHIRKFESAVRYLPNDMKRTLDEELNHCKKDIDRSICDNDNRLKDTCSSGDLNSIKSLLEEYKNSNGMKNYFNRGREFVLKSIQSVVINIKKCFEEHDIVEAFFNVKILHEYQVKFLSLFPDIRKPCLDVQNQIKIIFSEAYSCFFNRFLDSSSSMVTSDRVQSVEKNFVDLTEYMKFSIESKDTDNGNNTPRLIDMLPGDFNEKIKILNERLVEYLIEREKEYKEALEKLDVIFLKEFLDTSQQWNSLFVRIRDHYNIYHTIDDTANIVVKTIKEFVLFPKIVESIAPRIKELRRELIHQELINDLTKGFSKQRNEFYSKLNEKYSILSNAKQFSNYQINFDVEKAEQECLKSLETKITEISSNAEILLNRFIRDEKLDRREYDTFNLYYNNIISFKNEMKVIKFEINHKIENIENKFFEKVRIWEAQIESSTKVDDHAKILIHMKRTENNSPSFKIKIYETIDAIINGLKNSKNQTTAFGKLGILLNKDETGIGQSIVAEHKAFQGYSLCLFNEKIQRHEIDYVLERISGELLDKEKLKKRYDEFRAIYDSLVKQYLNPNVVLDQLIADTKLFAGDIKQNSDHIVWNFTIRNKVPKLVAHIFALWTLQNAHYYFEATEVNNRNSYLFQPHAAQVISIFRMLGIGDSKEELSNNLVQIGTGEGKSITLGATASILALLGFDVSCACYSEYLSQRDYTAFLSLFDSLGVLNHIHYGTFNRLCEYIINENGDIRQVVEQLVSKDSNLAVENARIIKRAKILLIDEVDVFFSRDFYGNIYIPATSLKDPSITLLINYIWAQRKSKLTLNRVQGTQEYKNCCIRFPKWELLIQEAIKDMISDVKSFESHNYVVKEDKIGYIELDNILYNVIYGYKTLFAYYFEHEKGKISEKSLEDNICIRIKCGSFSYAETPLKFHYIMGVTGTLVTLSKSEKETIKNLYRINKNTITPSVFGENNLQFTKRDDIWIANSNDYFNIIKREIDDRLRGKSSEQRAVFVFFESEEKLKTFYESKALESIKDFVVYLTEEASLTEKENLIKRATGSGQVTLFTKAFGRGTDFICHDPSVTSNGGIHVIQTFLSEEISEEVQIKGRTARQGDYGSYSMILLDDDLEKFQIGKSDIQDIRDGRGGLAMTYASMYDFLNDKRMIFFKFQYEANAKYVEQAKSRDKISQEFLLKLKSGDIDSIRKFLIDENKGVEGTSSSRTVCLMDATGSMSQLLQKSKNTVDIMFERAITILKDANISSDLFEVQFVVYRNYNSQEEKILQHSPWETKPDNLRAFMNTINVEGGCGNEAIEIGLWHANNENERENITQVILIGDAPPNTQNEVNKKRQRHGEDYWKKTKFAKATYYEDELAKLTLNKIPVHTFFVANDPEKSFREIARRTGGRSEFLDINSPFGSDILTALVTKEILRNIGGSSKGDDLVKAYEMRFGKSYT
ncbi:unnamed protein product [Rotaria sp. Silwood2]|nr:unnamed protein product [Rotaria sp. Silwood2]